MLTGMQIRIARSALGWSVAKLASESLVSARTINRLETEKEEFKITPANLRMIRETLEAAGIEFIGAPDNGPGVRLWRKYLSSRILDTFCAAYPIGAHHVVCYTYSMKQCLEVSHARRRSQVFAAA